MKKQIISITAVLSLLWGTFSACSDFLDETPKGNYIPQTIDDFAMMLDDYEKEGTVGKNRIGWGQSNTLTMTDDVQITATNQPLYTQVWGLNAYTWNEFLYEASEHDGDYENFYHVIYICNYIIEHIGEVKPGSEFSREEVEGAAYFHRANAYLNLVNEYARHYDAATADTDPGVVLMLSADPNLVLPRSSVAAVYQQILSDGEKALSLLPENVKYKFRPNRAAANALLARTCLYMGRYDACAGYALAAVRLVGEPFDYNTVSIAMGNPDFGYINFPAYTERYAYPDVILYKLSNDANYGYDTILSDELVNLFDPQYDLRFKLFVTPFAFFGMDLNPNGYYHYSYMADDNRGYGVGEVYVTAAEALARTGKKQEARTVLNTLLEKRYESGHFTPVTEDDQEMLLDLILNERRKELMFKGLRLFDLKRLNRESRYRKTVTHVYQGETHRLGPESNRYVLPIPLNVIEINPTVTQNPR